MPSRSRTPRPKPPRGFDFTGNIQAVCEDLVQRLPALHHIRMPQVAVSFSQARKSVSHGLQAALTPMRFEQGSRFTTRRGRRFGVQRIQTDGGVEILYILSLYLPRFQNQAFDEKLVTILHELWHISPKFDGDLRRHAGRYYAHTHSERQYDAAMARLARQWLDQNPPPDLYQFLQVSFDQLQRDHGAIYGTRITAPKLVPC